MTFKEIVRQRIFHDLGFGCFSKEGVPRRIFRIITKSQGVLCGLKYVPDIVEITDREFFLTPMIGGQKDAVKIKFFKKDGTKVRIGEIVAELYGNAEVLLKAERHILFVLRRLSGIATITAEEIKKISGTSVTLLDTRKDDPLTREMDKYAVMIGGGRNHRSGIYDGVLIKDNDIEVYGGIKKAINVRLKEARFLTKVEIEVDSIRRLKEVLADGRVDAIMLDNMSPALLKKAEGMIKRSPKNYLIEASGVGGFDLREIAGTGVGYISMSFLVSRGEGNPLDISMKVVSKK